MERESDETQQQQVRSLCRMGCGFYGSPSTENMCSKCFKDSIRRKQASPATGTLTPSQGSMEAIPQSISEGAVAASVTPSSSTTSESSSLEPASRQPEAEAVGAAAATAEAAAGETDPSEKGDKAKPKKNRCFMCRKKVGLTGFECRCGNVYCGLHRYSDKHDCTFDYKAAGRAKISKDNPVIVGTKIQKI